MNYEQSKTFSDLCQANIRFLNGELDRSPWNYGPICTETYPILNELIEMNQRGLLTTDSQPGCQIKNYLGRDYLQNAYVTFICRVDKAYHIISHLKGYLGYTDRDVCIDANLGHYLTNEPLDYPIIHTPRWDAQVQDLYRHHLWETLKPEYTNVCIFDPVPVRNELFSDLKNLASFR